MEPHWSAMAVVNHQPNLEAETAMQWPHNSTLHQQMLLFDFYHYGACADVEVY
jgi:hypothetical protein